MKNKLTLFSVSAGLALFVASCGSSAQRSEKKTPDVDTTTYDPVETSSPSAGYEPAFEGQTRAPGVKTTESYQIHVVTDKLVKPWGVVGMPDGRILVTEKEGKIRIVSQDGNVSNPIKGVPDVNSEGQGGLLDITLHPDFEKNKMVYWTFSEKLQDGNVTSVAKGKLSEDESQLQEVEVIYRATPAYGGRLHYGSRILFDKNGNIIFSTGERSDMETRHQAQDLNSALGKIIRITTDGKPVAGNPFENQAGARAEIYSYGHRNVQGLAFHPETGDLWESEFGPKGGDEINIIKPGKNYGWPTIGYGVEYSGDKVGDGIQQKDGMEQPIYYYDPSISPSGIAFYSGSKMSEWNNNLFVCALSGTHIARLVIKDDKVVGEERLLVDEVQRFRGITLGNDEALYAVTDQGRLYRIGK